LPTEAEWEYACRAGTTTTFHTGNNLTTQQANYNGNEPYNDNAKGVFLKCTQPVGSYAPNAWGLYDMHGNVMEFCSDYFHRAYQNDFATNPQGPSSGSHAIVRGGAWDFPAFRCRSADRIGFEIIYDNVQNDLGFRLAADL